MDSPEQRVRDTWVALHLSACAMFGVETIDLDWVTYDFVKQLRADPRRVILNGKIDRLLEGLNEAQEEAMCRAGSPLMELARALMDFDHRWMHDFLKRREKKLQEQIDREAKARPS